jgi:hypothetical protein
MATTNRGGSMAQTFLFRDFWSAEMLGNNGKPEEEEGGRRQKMREVQR